MPEELRFHQAELLTYLSAAPWPDTSSAIAPRGRRQKRGKRDGVSLDVYDRRAPIYRTTNQFVRTVLKDLQPETQEILKFAADTDEALFLFDDGIAEYLAEIFKRALRLHAVAATLENQGYDERTAGLQDEELTLADWFSKQFEEIRTRFAPFLRLQ
jgi:hypothetical protein